MRLTNTFSLKVSRRVCQNRLRFNRWGTTRLRSRWRRGAPRSLAVRGGRTVGRRGRGDRWTTTRLPRSSGHWGSMLKLLVVRELLFWSSSSFIIRGTRSVPVSIIMTVKFGSTLTVWRRRRSRACCPGPVARRVNRRNPFQRAALPCDCRFRLLGRGDVSTWNGRRWLRSS